LLVMAMVSRLVLFQNFGTLFVRVSECRRKYVKTITQIAVYLMARRSVPYRAFDLKARAGALDFTFASSSGRGCET